MAKTEYFFPVNLKLTGKTCLVIGGGSEARRKIRSLLESSATIKVVSPKVEGEISTLNRMQLITWNKKAFSTGDLKNIFLVITATGSKKINTKIFLDCQKRNILCTSDEDPAQSNFIISPTIRRGNLMFSVTTGGQSPAITAAIERELKTRYGREYAKFLKLIGKVRGNIQDKIFGTSKQRAIFQKLMQSDLMELQSRRNLKKFLAEVKNILNP